MLCVQRQLINKQEKAATISGQRLQTRQELRSYSFDHEEMQILHELDG